MGSYTSSLHALLEQPTKHKFPTEGRMYAIAFDLDTAQLQVQYPNSSWQNAYGDVKKTLISLGFSWQQGSVYFGDNTVTAVSCVLAAQQLSATYPWFKGCVSDIRMLRIEELNDLSAAI